MMLPAAGEEAPDFVLPNQFGEPVRLSALRGRPAVVVFYPFAFSGVCTGELRELRENLGLFTDRRVRLMAVSVDSKYTLRAYAGAEGLEFDLLADFWPHGEAAARYGVFDTGNGMATRGSFVIDAHGVIRSVIRSELGQPRSLAEYRRALDGLAPTG